MYLSGMPYKDDAFTKALLLAESNVCSQSLKLRTKGISWLGHFSIIDLKMKILSMQPLLFLKQNFIKGKTPELGQ